MFRFLPSAIIVLLVFGNVLSEYHSLNKFQSRQKRQNDEGYEGEERPEGHGMGMGMGMSSQSENEGIKDGQQAHQFFVKVQKLAYKIQTDSTDGLKELAKSIVKDLRQGGFCELKKGNVYGAPFSKLVPE